MIPDEFSDAEREHRMLLSAAEGYAELGLYDLAWAEFHRITPSLRHAPETLEHELLLHMKQEHWKQAVEVGRRLCNEAPDRPAGFVHTAYCLHEMGATAEALNTLRGGPDVLQEIALFHYNSACYLAVLGDISKARTALAAAFALDEMLRQFAQTDPDLNNLRRTDGSPGNTGEPQF